MNKNSYRIEKEANRDEMYACVSVPEKFSGSLLLVRTLSFQLCILLCFRVNVCVSLLLSYPYLLPDFCFGEI